MPDETQQPVVIACTACGGDPRRSTDCKSCGGAGVGIAGEDGFLVWSQSVDEFTAAFRKVKRNVNAVIHMMLLVFGAGALVALVCGIATLPDITSAESWDFWISGSWLMSVFWIGLLSDCFLIFRLSEFTKESKQLPNWGKLRSATEKPSEKTFRFDVSPYFLPEAVDVIESAYHLAKTFNRTEVTSNALFASALASPVGGLFLVRLGATFDRVKGGIARVLTADPAGQPPILLSRDAKLTLARAYADAHASHRRSVGSIEIFIRSFKDSPKMQEVLDQLGFPPDHVLRVAEWIRLQEQLREDHTRFIALAQLKPKSTMNRAMTARQTPLLDRFSEDLTYLAREGYVPPAVGRVHETESLLRAIESGRRSVALVGDHGTGKMALVEQLARRMVEEDVPKELFDRRLVSVDLAKVIAAGDPGLAAERLLSMLHEVGMSGNIILVLQGIEALTGSSSGGPMDLAEMFTSELDKGYFIAIVTTTPQSWTKYIERRSLGSKLIKVDVPEMNVDETIGVLMARSGAIEYQNNVFFSYPALERAASLADRYIQDKAAPEKALDVIREAAVLARKTHGENAFVSAEDVSTIVQEKTHIPMQAVTQNETEKLMSLEKRLHGRVIGQNEAVTAVSQALRRARAELREGKRPIANFLFLGPTGVGKTELTKALAAEYFGDEEAMIRLDMSEYQDKSSIVRMIGAPGDERGGLLTEAIRKKPFAIVLLDELEKAHPDILNLFLQVMDDGRLTDGVGRTVDFTNAMVIATSNAGTQFIQDEIAKQTPIERIKTGLLERELKGVYRPEFLNRFDGVIVFKPLTLDDVTQIAWLLVNGIAKRLEERGITFRAEDMAVEELAKAGFDPLFGARPLRRVLQERVDNGLADLLLQKKIMRKDTVILESDGSLRVESAPRI